MAKRSRVLLILVLFVGLAFLLTGCIKKIDLNLTIAIQGLGETDPAVGMHTYRYGTSVTLTATPAENYDFKEWEIEGLGSFSENVKEIVLKDSTLATAVFVKKSFNIEASVDPENGGTVIGAGSYLFGDTASLTAVAAEGFKFVEWTEKGLPISSDNPLEFVVSANRAFVAHFDNEYMVTVNVIPEEGGMASGGGKYVFGSEITVVATPAECYDFDGWFVGETLVSEEAEYTFTVTEDVDLVAKFTLKTFEVTVTAEPEEGGEVMGADIYDCGEEATVVATPAECYDFDGWFVGETLVSEDAEYTFTVTEDVDLVAKFTLKTFEVVATAGENGTITPEGTQTVECGDDITFAIVSDDCYYILDVLVDGESIGAVETYTFENVRDDHTIEALFEKFTYEVVATAGENGAVDPEGETVVDCGDDLLFTFTPEEGYGVDQVTVDNAPVDVVGSPETTDKTYNLEDIRDNHAIDATFKQVFFVTEFDFQGQSPLGNRYDVHIEVDPEVTLLKFSYPGDDTELPVAEAAVVGGVANIVNFFTLDDADFLLIKAFTADGNLLAEIVVELDYSAAFLKVATFTPKKEWSLPSAVIYDVHIEVSDNVDKVEFAYPGNPEAEPIPAMAVPVGGVIDIEMNSVDFDAEEITVMAYSGAELLVSKNFDLLKVIEVTCEFVADYHLILGIFEFKFTVAVNSPFCAFIEFAADGDIQVIEGNPFAVPGLGAYEFSVFVDSALNRVDVMAKDGADDKIAERNIDLP